jgi:hypothetical protein
MEDVRITGCELVVLTAVMKDVRPQSTPNSAWSDLTGTPRAVCITCRPGPPAASSPMSEEVATSALRMPIKRASRRCRNRLGTAACITLWRVTHDRFRVLINTRQHVSGLISRVGRETK